MDTQLVVYALLESKYAVGRFKFTVKPGFDTVIDTEAVIRTRRRLNNIGIAPIASRFFFGPAYRQGGAITARAWTIPRRFTS